MCVCVCVCVHVNPRVGSNGGYSLIHPLEGLGGGGGDREWVGQGIVTTKLSRLLITVL